MKPKCGAHHEAGHIVIAAVQTLRLRPEGIMVDPQGWGLACYYKEPEESDLSREQVILAALSGFKAENHFRAKSSYPFRDDQDAIDSSDWREAREIIAKLSAVYFANDTVLTILHRLEDRSEQLVDQHWLAIEAIAAALLEKDREPLKVLKSGGSWSHQNENEAKYLVGEEVVQILQQFGIAAICDRDC